MNMFLISLFEFGEIKCLKFVRLQKKRLCQVIMSRMLKIEQKGLLSSKVLFVLFLACETLLPDITAFFVI